MESREVSRIGARKSIPVDFRIVAATNRDLKAEVAAGVAPEGIPLDPGLGCTKTADQNLELLRHLPALVSLGFPPVVGGLAREVPEPAHRDR